LDAFEIELGKMKQMRYHQDFSVEALNRKRKLPKPKLFIKVCVVDGRIVEKMESI
jgi:hypothetical protein